MLFLSFLLGIVLAAASIHEPLNFVIPAQKRECFFEEISKEKAAKGPKFKVEVFLEAGGNMDISLTYHGPLELSEVYTGSFEDPFFSKVIDVNLESEYDTQTIIEAFTPTVAGHYALCLDNRKSRFVSKNVQVDIREDSEEPVQLAKIHGKTNSEPEADVEKIQKAVEQLHKIEKGINKIQMQQMRDKHRLSLHTDANESNYDEVFISSIIETLVFIGVSIFQICFVRRWFASRVGATRGKAPTMTKTWA